MTIRLYRYPLSGHAHRAELMLSLLGLPFTRVDVDLLGGEQRQPEFLARNPFGQVPVIEDGEVTVADSNAILVYLAGRYDDTGRWLPRDPAGAARVQRWLSVAAGPLAEGLARARADVVFGRPRERRPHEVAARLLPVMEQHLARQAFFADDHPTIADIALYTYTAHVPEGGISLEPYPQIRAWLARVEALPGFVGMQRSPIAPALAV
ncbi:glutathione S-transferase [Ideonella sp.]|uniref:glutathione S-transferase family protein n=1 Tax=Ideonella sp. TaxID=1929293 RepID=UPI002B47AD55|nr:glutathione S-transferase [Ideonella sp.]HJV71482.1 glutathione S-transferase [Ideonella sp.]